MRRGWLFLFRWLLACLIVMLLHWPFANYYWTMYQPTPIRTNASGDPHWVSGPGGEYTGPISEFTWRYALDLPDAALAAVLGILVYCALGRWFASPYPPTRCRRCTNVLYGLSKPQCPNCGEQI